MATPPAVDPAEFFVLAVPPDGARPQAGVRAEVRRKAHEARAGVLAERKALQDAAEPRELMAWNQAENQRLHELRMARLRQEEREQERRQAEEAARGSPRGGGLGPDQGAGSAAAAGGRKKLHHPRESGGTGTGGKSFGFPQELQLGHHQRGAGGQATAQGLLRSQ